MESSPITPDPAPPSSAVQRPAAESAPGSSASRALPPADPGDESPTIISLNRNRGVSAESIESLNGKQLGHFELIEPIGVGGMAAVIRAMDLQLGRTVALKILPPEMAVDPENISRFKQEARAAAKLDHENIARVYFCGEDQGLHFIAFEFVEGVDLRTLLNRHGPLPPAQAVKYMLQVAAGLAHAGSRGVVHRDIKPSNIIITPEGRAKIVDMGLARTGDASGGVTQSGVTLGTFDYISPEQAIEPRGADVRSDIYSLGCTFYHLLTGQPPVPEGTAAKKLHHHQHVAPTDPREINPAIPDELVAVLSKMMAKDPRDRYQRPEQLIQHLMVVANRMQIPADTSSQETMLFVDAPLPQPPRFSPVLAGVIAVAAVALLAVILGMSGPSGDPQPLPMPVLPRTEGKDFAAAAPPIIPTAPPPEKPVDNSPKVAATAAELAKLLEQKVETIILTSEKYDLSDLARTIPADVDPPRPLKVQGNLQLIGRTPSGQRPVIRWRAESGLVRHTDLALALLSIVPANGPVNVEVRNLRFEVLATDSNYPVYAIASQGASQLTVADCEFSHDGKRESPYGGAIRFKGGRPAAPESVLELKGCHFAESRGACAVEISNRAVVRASQCAFGPHAVLFLFSEEGIPAAPVERRLAELSHCTALMREGIIFDIDANVSGSIHAGNCVFARGGDSGEVVLVRTKTTDQRITYSGPLGPVRARNVYHRLVLWEADRLHRAVTARECREQNLPFRDPDAVELTAPDALFQELQPLEALNRPEIAFALNTSRPELRSLTRPDEVMVGVTESVFGPLYNKPLPVATAVNPKGPITEVIVDPSKPRDERQRRYQTLSGALADAPAGELTILIRHNGLFEIQPLTLAWPNLKLTLKPDTGYRPVLTLAETDAFNPSLFAIHNGNITFKNLHFRLGPQDESRWVSVVAIAGGGQVAFNNCTATFEADDMTQAALVTVTADADMAVAPRRPVPVIRLNDCVLRGRGHAVAVRGSRPIEFEADNVLAVLRGSLLLTTGQGKEPPPGPAAQFTLRRVTTYLTEAMLDLRCSESEKKVAGLVPMLVRCENCLLVAAGDRPLVHASGIDRDTLVKTLLDWEGTNNIYGNFQKMLDVKPGGSMMTMMTEWTRRDWLQFSQEPEQSFARVSFKSVPSDDDFTRVQPQQFRATLSDMMRDNASAAPYGANLSQLPRFEDE